MENDISEIDDNFLLIKFMDLVNFQARGIGDKNKVADQLAIAYKEILRRMAKEE